MLSMKRRSYLAATLTTGVFGAGCLGSEPDGGEVFDGGLPWPPLTKLMLVP